MRCRTGGVEGGPAQERGTAEDRATLGWLGMVPRALGLCERGAGGVGRATGGEGVYVGV